MYYKYEQLPTFKRILGLIFFSVKRKCNWAKMNMQVKSAFLYIDHCYILYYKNAAMLSMFREIMLKSANGINGVYAFRSAGIL